MIDVSVPLINTWYNLYTLSSIATTKSLVVTNKTSAVISLSKSALQPINIDDDYVLYPGQTIVVPAGSIPTWVLARNAGDILVQELIGDGILPYSTVTLQPDLYTSSLEYYRRLRVDIGSTGFFRGLEFRTFKELSISQGTTYTIRAVVPINVILLEQGLEVDAGSLRIRTYIGGTAGGTYSETLPIVARNSMSEIPQPPYVSQVVFTAGGTQTDGTLVDVHRRVVSNATATQATIGGALGFERGLAANTYYVKFENIGTGTVTGTTSFAWEERP